MWVPAELFLLILTNSSSSEPPVRLVVLWGWPWPVRKPGCEGLVSRVDDLQAPRAFPCNLKQGLTNPTEL